MMIGIWPFLCSTICKERPYRVFLEFTCKLYKISLLHGHGYSINFCIMLYQCGCYCWKKSGEVQIHAVITIQCHDLQLYIYISEVNGNPRYE